MLQDHNQDLERKDEILRSEVKRARTEIQTTYNKMLLGRDQWNYETRYTKGYADTKAGEPMSVRVAVCS